VEHGGVDAGGPIWDYLAMIVTLDAKGRLSLPVALAPAR
jgi:hypothetical protein